MTFYKYFPSKAKLIEECLNQRNQNLQASLNATINGCDDNDPLSKIRAIYLWYSAWFETEDFNGCMFQKPWRRFLRSILLRLNLQLNTKNG